MLRPALLLLVSLPGIALAADDPGWPQWRGPAGDGTWAAAPAVAKSLPDGELERLWRAKIGSGYSGVTAAGGSVFTMDKQGEGDTVTERVLCLDAATGEPRWTHAYEASYKGLDYGSGPRASVTIHGGKAYAFGAAGHAHCLDAATGAVLWKADTVADFGARRPTWGFAGCPAIWKESVILHIGAADACYIALDKATGEVAWRGGTDPVGYGTPIFVRHGGEDLMIGWTPENIAGFDPDTGEQLWAIPYAVKYGVSIATPIFHENLALVCGYWHGSRAIRLGKTRADAELAWEEDEFLHGLMAQPLYKNGFVYLLDKEHGLTCFRLADGKKLWDDDHRITPSDRNPQATFVRLGGSDEVLILNANGELIHGALRESGYEEFWRAQAAGKTWAHPAYANGCAFTRDDRQIAAYRLPVE